ncbi:MAG: helix-turn-helix transcriptional regulator [Thermodesulfobacteriota bacterium]
MKIKSEKKHWTERSIKDYLFRIVADFIAQLETKMESIPISQDEYAKKLRVSKGRVSQLLNHPGNFKLENIIKYAKALGMKVSVMAYDDNDPKNIKGPINSEIFKMCWEQLGKPHDFWAMQDIAATNNVFGAKVRFGRRIDDFKVSPAKQTSWGNVVACPQYVSIEKSAGNQKELPS